VVAAEQVLLVEGEKDVESLERLGFVATCTLVAPARTPASGSRTTPKAWRVSGLSSFRTTTRPARSTRTSSRRQFATGSGNCESSRSRREGRIGLDRGWRHAGDRRPGHCRGSRHRQPRARNRRQSAAAGDSSLPSAGASGLPQIQVNDRPFARSARNGFEALTAFNTPPAYSSAPAALPPSKPQKWPAFHRRFRRHEAPALPGPGRRFLRALRARRAQGSPAAAGCRQEYPGAKPGNLGAFRCWKRSWRRPRCGRTARFLAQPGYDAASRLYLVRHQAWKTSRFRTSRAAITSMSLWRLFGT